MILGVLPNAMKIPLNGYIFLGDGKMKRAIVLCVVTLMVSVANANLLVNGDLEQWTGGEPDSWLHASAPVAESTQLNGTSSAQLSADVSQGPSDYHFKQLASNAISASDDFYVGFDFAFEDATDGRDLNVNIQNNATLSQDNSIVNLKYEGGILSIYDSGWQSIDSSGLLTASDFDSSIVHPYQMAFEGILGGAYALTITDLETDTVILNVSGLNYYHHTPDGINTVSFDLSRGTNDILVDNLTIVPEPATLILLGMGSFLGLRRRKD